MPAYYIHGLVSARVAWAKEILAFVLDSILPAWTPMEQVTNQVTGLPSS